MRFLSLLLLSLPGTAALADISYTFGNVTVTGGAVLDSFGFPPLPGCGGESEGMFSASINTSCDGGLLTAGAEGQTSVGPYGIGGIFNQGANGARPYAIAVSMLSFSWSQGVIIKGGTGSGYALVTVDGLNNVNEAGFWAELDMTLFNEQLVGSEFTGMIPVTFGMPYTLTMDGSSVTCFGDIHEACGTSEFFVSALSFEDSNGNPLPGAMLVDLPEASSWLLLATCGVPALIWRRRGARTVGSH